MTALGARIRRRIRLGGPITLAQYMAEALANPADGYYGGEAGGAVIGARGDFVTAPEISQMFGELIGLWCAEMWRRMGAPDPVRLVELGPGRGTLMADALRAAATVPALRAALRIHLVETSPRLRARQAETLAGSGADWHDSLADAPDGPLLLVANEFFDALPIHQFTATAAGWRERLVGVAGDGRLALCAAPGATPALALLDRLGVEPVPGAVAELCPAGIALAATIGARVAAERGAALIIDYGAGGALGGSVQAVRAHRVVAPLAEPGAADLSAHVDFAALARAAREAGAAVHGPVAQGAFLRALGLEARAARLARRATPAQQAALAAACARLAGDDQMGALYKVLAIAHPALPTPAGFGEE
ncbi:MAG TPA: SAM-dependent methyltransferase [Alphaproteobacteria bacterium]